MCFMHIPENLFPVQQAVCPVIIGIVQNDHQQNAEHIVKVAVFVQRAVNERYIMIGGPPYRQNHQPKNDDRGKGIGHLTENVFVSRETLLNFQVPVFPFLIKIENKKNGSRKGQILQAEGKRHAQRFKKT